MFDRIFHILRWAAAVALPALLAFWLVRAALELLGFRRAAELFNDLVLDSLPAAALFAILIIFLKFRRLTRVLGAVFASSAFGWRLIRQRTELLENSTNYDCPDEQLAAAVRLESLGEWDAAVLLYRDVAERWPEHNVYVQHCVKRIDEKQALAPST